MKKMDHHDKFVFPDKLLYFHHNESSISFKVNKSIDFLLRDEKFEYYKVKSKPEKNNLKAMNKEHEFYETDLI